MVMLESRLSCPDPEPLLAFSLFPLPYPLFSSLPLSSFSLNTNLNNLLKYICIVEKLEKHKKEIKITHNPTIQVTTIKI